MERLTQQELQHVLSILSNVKELDKELNLGICYHLDNEMKDVMRGLRIRQWVKVQVQDYEHFSGDNHYPVPSPPNVWTQHMVDLIDDHIGSDTHINWEEKTVTDMGQHEWQGTQYSFASVLFETSTLNKWEGEYGRLRMELVKHLEDKATEELENDEGIL